MGEGGFSSPQKAALASFPNTLALNEAWAVDGVLKQPEKVVRNPRRASHELRQDMRALGEGRYAFFLAVEQRPLGSFGLDPLKGAGATKIHPDSWERLPLDSQVSLFPSTCDVPSDLSSSLSQPPLTCLHAPCRRPERTSTFSARYSTKACKFQRTAASTHTPATAQAARGTSGKLTSESPWR